MLVALTLLAVTLWAHGPVVVQLFDTWQHNEDYSAGQLVPPVAVFLFWRQRRALRGCPLVPCWGGGMALLLAAQVTRLYGFLSGHPLVEQYMLVPTLAGLVLTAAGWPVFRRVAWLLLFLFLALRLPASVHHGISDPLQRGATAGAAFLLEAFGVRVAREGNILRLDGATAVAVAEACGGLRMLTAFVMVAAFIAFLVKRPPGRKAAVLLASLPVGVVCNIVRIFVTAVLTLHVSSAAADKFFHDGAGLVMMPVAVFLLFGVLRLIDRLVLPVIVTNTEST